MPKPDFFICFKTKLELYRNAKFIRNFHVPSYDFYLQSLLNFSVRLGPKTRNIGASKTMREKSSLEIFLHFRVVLVMPHSPAKDYIVTLTRLF